MRLTINGEPRDVAAVTVLALLEEIGLDPAASVVELNGVIVARATYGDAALTQVDVLEIVRIVGGG